MMLSSSLDLETCGLGLFCLAQWSCLHVNALNSVVCATHDIDTFGLTDCVVKGNDITECHVFAKVFESNFCLLFCNDSFSMCHIATLMYGLGHENSGLGIGLETCGLVLEKGLVYITGYVVTGLS